MRRTMGLCVLVVVVQALIVAFVSRCWPIVTVVERTVPQPGSGASEP